MIEDLLWLCHLAMNFTSDCKGILTLVIHTPVHIAFMVTETIISACSMQCNYGAIKQQNTKHYINACLCNIQKCI